jgi:hypothetical protein
MEENQNQVNQVNPQVPPEPTTPKVFTFTIEELKAHDSEIQESAYRKAAVNTIQNLVVLDDYPIAKAIKKLGKYAAYLIKTYNLERR